MKVGSENEELQFSVHFYGYLITLNYCWIWTFPCIV